MQKIVHRTLNMTQWQSGESELSISTTTNQYIELFNSKNHFLYVHTVCNFQRLLMFSLLRSTTMPFAFCYVYTPQSSRIAVVNSHIYTLLCLVQAREVREIHFCSQKLYSTSHKSDTRVEIAKRRMNSWESLKGDGFDLDIGGWRIHFSQGNSKTFQQLIFKI